MKDFHRHTIKRARPIVPPLDTSLLTEAADPFLPSHTLAPPNPLARRRGLPYHGTARTRPTGRRASDGRAPMANTIETPDRATPRISVIIPHRNAHDHLANCLDTLAAQRRAPDEVIVVDNGSAEPPEALCAAHPGTVLMHEPTPGPGPARTTGAQAARGDVLAFIDADCLADPGWLEAAAREIVRPGTDVLGGDMRVTVARPGEPDPMEAYELEYAYRMDRYIAREGYTATANLVMRREVFEQVGPFPGLGVAEDMVWGQRATGMGFALRFVPDMRVRHPAHRDMGELQRKWDRHTAHFYEMARARPGGLWRWAVRAAAMPVSPLGEIPRVMRSDRLPDNAARLRAFRTLVAIRLYRTRLMWRVLVRDDPEVLLRSWHPE